MVDLTDSFLILKAVLVVGFLFLQGLGPVGGLDRGTDIGGQIDAAKAGKDGGKTDGVDDSNVFRQKAKDGKDSHKWSQHQGIYNQPHGGRQTGGNLPQISPETEPGQRPKQQAKEQSCGVEESAPQVVFRGPGDQTGVARCAGKGEK